MSERDKLLPSELVERLSSDDWSVRDGAAQSLAARGPEVVTTLADGMAHSDWRVRAQCAALMDHLADEQCLEALLSGLHDPSPHVRRHSVHSLGCQRCKNTSLPVDVVSHLIDRSLNDTSIRVRRVAVHQLGLQPPDLRAFEALKSILISDTDQKLLSRAEYALKNQFPLQKGMQQTR